MWSFKLAFNTELTIEVPNDFLAEPAFLFIDNWQTQESYTIDLHSITNI